MVTDEELMARYIDGDRDAFAELFARYAPLLLHLMQYRSVRPEDARDLVQQTFLQLHRSRADFRRDAHLRPWLLTIAANLKRRHFRRLGRRSELLFEFEALEQLCHGQAPGGALEAADEVRWALAELPADQREVITLHWFAGLPFSEVATLVGASLAAVKARAHRGYETIRKGFARQSPPASAARCPTRVKRGWP